MKFFKRLLVLSSLLLAQSSSAIYIDYHALLTSFFTTNGYYVGLNTNNGSAFSNAVVNIVNSNVTPQLWGTNSATGGITNINSGFGRVNVGGTNAVITADTGPAANNNLLIGQTNGANQFWLRNDGSIFSGADNNSTFGDQTDFGSHYHEVGVFYDLPGRPQRIINQFALSSSDFATNATYFQRTDINDQSSPYSMLTLRATGAALGRTDQLELYASPGGGSGYTINYTTNGVRKFTVQSQSGDLTSLKGVTYSFPTNYGSGTNFVLTMINTNGGVLNWSPGLLSTEGTNEIKSLVTNGINQNARIGPGTNNVLAKFTVGGTNVGNSPLQSSLTNSVEQRPRADGGDFNVSSTNKIVGRETSGGDTNWLEIVAGGAGISQVSHIRAQATGAASQRLGILINDAWVIEPASNQLGGHNAGTLSPNVANTYSMGDANSINSITCGTGFISLGVPASTSFPGIRIGAAECGISSRGVNDLSFWRPTTGITGGFWKDENNGALILDIAGNGLVFGQGISNGISGFVDSAIVGIVQVGFTNSTIAAPLAQGLIAAQGSGTDKGGSDFKLIGGTSTGTGTNGNVRIMTSEKALATSSALNTSKDRLYVMADPVILTTNSATIVFNMTLPTALRSMGGIVIAHTQIEDGTDIAAVDDHFSFTAVRKGTTVTTAISASAPQSTLATGAAVLTTTWTAVANAQSVDIKCNAVTSGILSSNSTTRVTIIPNSSAIPVITHP